MTRKLFASLFLSISFMCSVTIAATHTETATLNAFGTATTLACAQRAINPCSLLQITREVLPSSVVHYKALIRVGAGDYDVIALHRLIRESGGVGFVHTVGSFFFVHNILSNFSLLMIDPRGGGLGVFLAERNIDVWGIDLRNTQIPTDVDNPSAGLDWDVNLQIKDATLGTRIARLVRASTGQKAGKLIMGGHSFGGTLTFAVANAEAVMSAAETDVNGIIPVDAFYKLPETATDQDALHCFYEWMLKSWVAGGSSLFDSSGDISVFTLARTDPYGMSPVYPWWTNLQAAMETAGGTPFWPMYPFHPFGVIRDSSGAAVAGRYTSTEEILHNYSFEPRYQVSMLSQAEMMGCGCATSNSPHVSHIADIKVPVLYVASAGGVGELGTYPLQLLGSEDKTLIRVKLMPDSDVVDDYGHIDPFTANNARELIWQPIQVWIVKHSQ